MKIHTVFIALGSNIGDRMKALKEASDLLPPDINSVSFSKVYETPPWGYEDQSPFLNQVIKAQTHLSPCEVLKRLKEIERELGRQPIFRYGPRLIDLDILFYDEMEHKSEELTIPHPEIANRAFVLVPLMEIAPNYIHPVTHKKIVDMAAQIETGSIIEYRGENE